MTPKPTTAKLQITGDSTVLCHPDPAALAMVGPLPATTTDPAAADVALAVVSTPEEVEAFMTGPAAGLADARAVWLLYPKGGRAKKIPVNRDSIWAQMGPHGWRLVSNVSVDDTWSALRARPLKPGESAEVPGA
jgi:hypothetical protein